MVSRNSGGSGPFTSKNSLQKQTSSMPFGNGNGNDPSLQFQNDWTAEQAFFQKKVNSLLCLFFEGERPLAGLAGVLDWRLQGQISRLIVEGKITGQMGERVYLPVVTPAGGTYSRVFLLGGGKRERVQKKAGFSDEFLKEIQIHFSKIGVGPIGISQSDFNESSESFYKKWFSEIPFWVFR